MRAPLKGSIGVLLKGSISIGGPLKGSKMAPLKDLRGLLGRDL